MWDRFVPSTSTGSGTRPPRGLRRFRTVWRSNLRLLLIAFGALASGCSGGGEGASCLSSRHCSSELICDLDRAMCVECLTDVDCPSTAEVCANRQCAPLLPCSSSRQCPGQVCDTTRGFCTDCLTDTDCPGLESCTNGLCQAPPAFCESDRQCSPRDQVCDLTRGVCADCVRDTDCDDGRVCTETGTCAAGGSCVSGTAGCADATSVRSCVSGRWSAPSPCPGSTVCQAGVCTSPASCTVTCRPGETCAGNVCSCGADRCESNETCVSGTCQAVGCSPSCATGETCSDHQCFCGAGPACRTSERCQGGTCVALTGACGPSSCGLFPQCGCGSGQGCYLTSSGSGTTSCQAAGSGANGAVCAFETDCAVGHVCVHVTTTTGNCRPLCREDSDCGSNPASGCATHLPEDVSTRNEGVRACTGGCDLLTSSGCPGGQSCQFYSHPDGVQWVTECRSAAATDPVVCTNNVECPRGTFCNGAPLGQCATFCRYPGGACGVGSCQPFGGGLNIGGVEYGYCG